MKANPRDSAWEEIMRQCQVGLVKHTEYSTWRSGRVCLKPDLCRQEGMCYFVAQFERHDEREARKESA